MAANLCVSCVFVELPFNHSLCHKNYKQRAFPLYEPPMSLQITRISKAFSTYCTCKGPLSCMTHHVVFRSSLLIIAFATKTTSKGPFPYMIHLSLQITRISKAFKTYCTCKGPLSCTTHHVMF